MVLPAPSHLLYKSATFFRSEGVDVYCRIGVDTHLGNIRLVNGGEQPPIPQMMQQASHAKWLL